MQRGFGSLLLIVGVFVVALVIGGAFYIGRSTSPKPTSPAFTNLQPQSAALNETASWKTYINTDLKYSIKYPSDIFVQYKCLLGELLLQKRQKGEIEEIVDEKRGCEGDSRFTVEIVTPVGEVDEPKTDEYYEVKKESILIDSIEGAKYTILDKTDSGEWVGMEVFIKKNRLHRIWLKDKELLPVFDQMLTTFKFLK